MNKPKDNLGLRARRYEPGEQNLAVDLIVELYNSHPAFFDETIEDAAQFNRIFLSGALIRARQIFEHARGGKK